MPEASAPLQTQNAASYTLLFDNTGGLATGVPANNQTILRDDTGAVLATDSIRLGGSGHLPLVVTDLYAAGQRRGVIELQTPANGQISAVVIRAASSGAYTTIRAATK